MIIYSDGTDGDRLLNWHEALRKQYRPDEIKVLFVGESPPAQGTFFYAGNSNLYKYTKEAFRKVFHRDFADSNDFLEFFKASGCYLDDICLAPVNRLGDVERKAAVSASIPDFTERLRSFKRVRIICVKRSIRGLVDHVISSTQLNLAGAVVSLPFPSLGHQRRYVSSLIDALKDLQTGGIL